MAAAIFSFTPEDQLIVLRAIERGNIVVLSEMLIDDRDDAIRFHSRVEGRACDADNLAQAQEEFHAWAQSIDDEQGE